MGSCSKQVQIISWFLVSIDDADGFLCVMSCLKQLPHFGSSELLGSCKDQNWMWIVIHHQFGVEKSAVCFYLRSGADEMIHNRQQRAVMCCVCPSCTNAPVLFHAVYGSVTLYLSEQLRRLIRL